LALASEQWFLTITEQCHNLTSVNKGQMLSPKRGPGTLYNFFPLLQNAGFVSPRDTDILLLYGMMTWLLTSPVTLSPSLCLTPWHCFSASYKTVTNK